MAADLLSCFLGGYLLVGTVFMDVYGLKRKPGIPDGKSTNANMGNMRRFVPYFVCAVSCLSVLGLLTSVLRLEMTLMLKAVTIRLTVLAHRPAGLPGGPENARSGLQDSGTDEWFGPSFVNDKNFGPWESIRVRPISFALRDPSIGSQTVHPKTGGSIASLPVLEPRFSFRGGRLAVKSLNAKVLSINCSKSFRHFWPVLTMNLRPPKQHGTAGQIVPSNGSWLWCRQLLNCLPVREHRPLLMLRCLGRLPLQCQRQGSADNESEI